MLHTVVSADRRQETAPTHTHIMKQKSPFLRIEKKRAFTIWTSRFTSFTTKKFFGKTLQAGLLTGGSSYWLHLPGKPFNQFKPFKRLFSGSCNVRHRLQRRYRSLYSDPK